jgi:hypothetical protein
MSVPLVPIPVKDISTPSYDRGYLPYTTRIRDEACVESSEMREWIQLKSGLTRAWGGEFLLGSPSC